MSSSVMLAIETSQRIGSVALRDQSGGIDVEVLRQTKRHDDDLMPAIDRVVNRAGLSPADLEAVAVSIGPGGFTGLRIAVTTAKMLGEALETLVVAVPSALVAAESCDLPSGQVAVALASKRTSFWLTVVHRDAVDKPWAICGQPGIFESEAWDLAGIRRVVADEHFPMAARDRCETADVPISEPAFDAAACLRIGERLLRAGTVTHPFELTPIYPRKPEAVAIWDQRDSMRKHETPDA